MYDCRGCNERRVRTGGHGGRIVDAISGEDVLRIAIGCVLLLAGRNVFWLAVGLVGFLLGFELAGALFAEAGEVWLAVLSEVGS